MDKTRIESNIPDTFEEISVPSNSSKLIWCNVHGGIRLGSMALRIIDTPEFKRMKKIKQLGLCHHVYPTATHTRFEHSIGVYHLAGKMLEKIKHYYPDNIYCIPELNLTATKLTDKIIECIKIAGLCHDLGHGPFSHIFDDMLLKNSVHPNRFHETRSCLIMEMICKTRLADCLSDNEIAFIKSIIDPSPHHTGALYQIVANKLNGIDVDKFDYLYRDTENVGNPTGFDSRRIIDEFIIDCNGNIAYPKQYSHDIYDMFHSRFMMHKKVYSHKTVKLIELMLLDLFNIIDPIFGISSSIDNMENFCKLTDDSIFQYMESIVDPPSFLQPTVDANTLNIIRTANDIYKRIISRKLYRLVKHFNNAESIEEVNQYLENYLLAHPQLDRSDFVICSAKIGFVSGNFNPFDSIYFYEKKESNHTITLRDSHIYSLMKNKPHEIHHYLVYKK